MSRASVRLIAIASTLALLAVEAIAPPGAHAVPPLPAASATAATTSKTAALGGVRSVVRDARTGAPVPRACAALVPVDLVALTSVMLGEEQSGRPAGCTDEQGNLSVDGVTPGRYRLLVRPSDTARHGSQWVGRHGGTGERERAQVIRVRGGAVTRAPEVRLDPPGTIVGVVTDAATGQPIRGASVLVVPFLPHPKYGENGVLTDEQGRYTMTGLGPYHWPLQFAATGRAIQWSGGVANRLQARPVRVRSDRTVTADQALTAGTVVSGVVLVDELATYAQVVAFNTVTGDLVGVADAGSPYMLRLLPGQRVKLRCDCSYRLPEWHRDAAGFDAATPVRVGRAPVVVDFDLG
ncbi:MSCRAMM family protein [Micromonospora profundi]|uniref:MSCRAMM family protein n=1 Tax=Micromonospora profundi TaxID=1420889 RepID=UPI0036B47920